MVLVHCGTVHEEARDVRLRPRMVLTAIATMTTLVILLMLVSRSVVLGGFLHQEQDEAREDLQRAENALAVKVDRLNATCRDWSNWTETCDFVTGIYPEYVDINLQNGTFLYLGIDLAIFVNLTGQVVLVKSVDLVSGSEVPPPQGVGNLTRPGSPLLHGPDDREGRAGLVLVDGRPLLIASWPVLPGTDGHPACGTLMMGRFLESDVVAELSTTVQLQVEVRAISDPTLPRDMREAIPEPAHHEMGLVRVLDRENVAAYAMLHDMEGAPAAVMKVTTARDIFNQGVRSLNDIILWTLAVTLPLTFVSVYYLDRFLVRRLARLQAAVRTVTVRGDPSLRVTVDGNDDIGMLATEINAMLGTLESAQSRLCASEGRYRALFEGTRDAIIIADAANGTILDANRQAETLLGRSHDEVVGMHQAQLHPPDEAERARAAFEDHLRTNGRLPAAMNVISADGRKVPVEIKASVVDLEGRKVLIGVFRDATERQEAERRLVESRHRTELYLDILSHDINNHNQSVVSYCEMLQNRVELTDAERRWLRNALHEARAITNLIGNVRKLSELKVMDVNLKAVDVTPVLEAAIAHVKTAHPGRTVIITHDLPRAGVVVAANELLTDVLVNLLDNAVKYDRHPAAIVEVVHRPVPDGSMWRLEFRDHGPGVPDDLKARLFTRLVRGTDYVPGTGLGLAIVREISTHYGGSVSVEDRVKGEPGAGAVFVLELPRRAA
jgi:PAS domain S-box-containing protein